MARVSKENWIIAALDLLAEKGIEHVRVEPIAQNLKITKGSFYHHFKNRSDLHFQMLGYWENRQFDYLNQLKATPYSTPKEELRSLFLYIMKKDVRHDIAIRHWSVTQEEVRVSINRIDQHRLDYCASIFHKMGFKAVDKIARAQFVYYSQVAEQHIFLEQNNYDPLEMLERRMEILLQ